MSSSFRATKDSPCRGRTHVKFVEARSPPIGMKNALAPSIAASCNYDRNSHPSGIVVSDADYSAVEPGFESRRRQGCL
ncbi:hypothetical protein TNCV_2209501 [Trichonephila clavipes]|nr:hypothetical protein TNCV_2209501 [Trichonephila clavipes]